MKNPLRVNAEDLDKLPAQACQAMERTQKAFDEASRGITEAFRLVPGQIAVSSTVDALAVAAQALAKMERSIRQGSLLDVLPKRGSSLPPGARASWRRGTWA